MKLCRPVSSLGWCLALMLCICSIAGCVTEAPGFSNSQYEPGQVLIMGHVVTVLTGERARKFEPAVRDIELLAQPAGRRYRVSIDGDTQRLATFLPPGRYELTRVKIHEGPFLSIAQVSSSFSVQAGPPVFVGTWRFGLDSPRYGRRVAVSIVSDEEARQKAEKEIQETNPDRGGAPPVTVIPEPAEMEARLYEVAPYPRISRYFRRHYW